MLGDGDILLTYLTEKHINKSKLAGSLGMSRQNLYQLFNTSNFTKETVAALEKVLNIRFKDLKKNKVVNIDKVASSYVDEPDVGFLIKKKKKVIPVKDYLERKILDLEQELVKRDFIIAELNKTIGRLEATVDNKDTLIESLKNYIPMKEKPVG